MQAMPSSLRSCLALGFQAPLMPSVMRNKQLTTPEGQIMESLNKLEQALDSLGLWKAVNGFPALLVPIVLAFAILEVLAMQLGLHAGGAFLAVHLSIVLVATLVGLIGYFGGNFWDSIFFGPRYGLEGKWIHTSRRPYHLFPAGEDLAHARQEAINASFATRAGGRGVYRNAKSFVQEETDKWDWVEKPLILSKFVRTFIWPAFLIFVVCVISITGIILFDLRGNVGVFLAVGALSFIFALLLFIPYFDLRVEHMVRLYEMAVRKMQTRASGSS